MKTKKKKFMKILVDVSVHLGRSSRISPGIVPLL